MYQTNEQYIPKTAVASILEARQSAAAAQEAASICTLKARQMEHDLAENAELYNATLRRYQVRLDQVENIARGNRIVSILNFACALAFLIAALLRLFQ